MDTNSKTRTMPASSMTQLPSIRSLMSPPEANALQSPTNTPPSKSNRLPSYSPENKLAPFTSRLTPETGVSAMGKQYQTSDVAHKLLSPPTSPWEGKGAKELDQCIQGNGLVLQEGPVINARDPILFPNVVVGSQVQQVLFSSTPFKEVAEVAVSKHMAETVHKFNRKIKPPTREEYMLALTCVPNIGRSYNKNPGAYMKRQREEEEEIYRKTKRLCAAPGQPKHQLIQHRPIAPRPARQPRKPAVAVISLDRPKRTPRPTPKASPENQNLEYADTVSPRILGLKYPIKALPKIKAITKPAVARSATPEVRTPVTKRDDNDYNALPDYSPSLSTLEGSPVGLKTDWTSNNPYDHANDPDRHLLHASEVKVAETLRLSCAQYLCSKRRIFEARLNALRVGKHFRKTDAQKACKIDVNKASKLFAAFEKVGWLDASHCEKYL